MVRTAVVGCGRISDLHALGYRGVEGTRIVAVCDTRQGRARAKAKAWGVDKVYAAYEDLLADPDVDLVELLVPHHLHAEMTIAACAAGKHVSVQKPMALSVAEAEAMIAAAGRAGVVLRVYENFVFYPPCVRAKEMIDAGEIGEPQMIRVHFYTGSRSASWKVPLSAWIWRFDERRSGGGPMVFDHGHHHFALARHLLGEVERVYAWIDRTPVLPTKYVDAPATIMFQFKSPRRYGTLDICHASQMRIESDYYADGNHVEVIGDRGILLINRWTTRTVDLPPLMMFRDGKTAAMPVERVDWSDSFVDCTRHLVGVLRQGGEPMLDGPTGREVLRFSLAAQRSARTGLEVRPDDVT